MSDKTPLHEPHAMVTGVHSAMKADTGDVPRACPWMAFADPLVADVLEAFPFFDKGQLATLFGDDPPSLLVEGVGHYHRVINRIRGMQIERDEKERERKREIPPNAVLVGRG